MDSKETMSTFLSRLRNIEWNASGGEFLAASIFAALFTMWLLSASGRLVHTQTVFLSLAASQGLVCFIRSLEWFGISPRPRRSDVDDLHITR